MHMPWLQGEHRGAARTCICPGCRENTEGEYSGLEHEVIPGVVESLKVSLTMKQLLACIFGRTCLAVALSQTYHFCVVCGPAPADCPDGSQPRCNAHICSPTAITWGPSLQLIVQDASTYVVASLATPQSCHAQDKILLRMPLQIITRAASTRVAEYAFKYAQDNGRKKVSAVHKANIMKLTDGLFIKCCREGAPTVPLLLTCTTAGCATLCFLCSASGPRVLLPLSAVRAAPHCPKWLFDAAMSTAHGLRPCVTCCGLC